MLDHLTAEYIIFYVLCATLCLLVTMVFVPTQIAGLFKRKRVAGPLLVSLSFVLVVYFQATYQEYKETYSAPPEGSEKGSLEFVTWQKNRTKAQRNMYLGLSCLLAQLFLYSLSHWIGKYHNYIEFKEREKKMH